MYAFVAGAVGGAILPQIVRVHIETLLPLTLYDDAKLVSASLDLMQLEFRQKENLIRALSEIQARPHGLARMRTMSAYSCAMLYFLGLVLCSGRLTTSVFNVARIPGTATVRWRYAHRLVRAVDSELRRPGRLPSAVASRTATATARRAVRDLDQRHVPLPGVF